MATKLARIKKRQLKEDQFVTTTFQIAGYFQHHRTRVILAVAGSVFLIVVVALFFRFQANAHRNSAMLLSQGVGMFQAGNYPDAAYRLSNFVQANSRHDDAPYAALLCGDANFYLSRWEDAGRHYRLALEKSDEGSEIWLAGRAGLASVEEGLGRSVEAAKIYEELAGMHEDAGEKAHMTFSAIRAYRIGGSYTRAAARLEKLDEDALDPIDQASLERQKMEIEFALSGGATATD